MIDLSTLPIDITSHILNFRNFLNSSWPWLDALMEAHDWDEDGSFTLNWMQVNWEFLIERELLGKGRYLLPIEWNNRITFPGEPVKYKIVCELKDKVEMKDRIRKTDNYSGEELLIFGFLTQRDISYGIYPPFDYVDVRTREKNKAYVVPINCCRFMLKLIDE